MTTNEIEKQLANKADNYIADKADEIMKVLNSITDGLSYEPSFYNYLKDHKVGGSENHYWNYCSKHELGAKLREELNNNFKEKLIKQYITELLSKINLLG